MRNKALATIEKYKMFENTSCVVAGVSGGADSMALLHLLCALKDEYGFEVIACHIHHGIRGAEADGDMNFVRSYCNANGVECVVKQFDIPQMAQKLGQSEEECGRKVRYQAFSELAGKKNAVIATAHTLSDVCETVLINMARGTGIKGLCGIPAVRGSIVRPLISATRDDVERYCTENNISYVTDSTNLSNDYTRNKIRHKVIPVLKEINPDFENSVLRMCENLGDDEMYLSEIASNLLQGSKIGENSYNTAMLSAPEPIKKRAAMSILRTAGTDPGALHINSLCGIIDNGGKINPSGGVFIENKNGILSVANAGGTPQAVIKNESFILGKSIISDGITAEIKIIGQQELENSKKIYPKLLKNCFDYDNIVGTAFWSFRKNGDSFTPAKRNCSKTLKKLFNEAKLSEYERSRALILRDGAGIAWINGFGCDKRLEITADTKRIAVVTITDNNIV